MYMCRQPTCMHMPFMSMLQVKWQAASGKWQQYVARRDETNNFIKAPAGSHCYCYDCAVLLLPLLLLDFHTLCVLVAQWVPQFGIIIAFQLMWLLLFYIVYTVAADTAAASALALSWQQLLFTRSHIFTHTYTRTRTHTRTYSFHIHCLFAFFSCSCFYLVVSPHFRSILFVVVVVAVAHCWQQCILA